MAKYQIMQNFTVNGKYVSNPLGVVANKCEAKRVLTKFYRAYESLGDKVVWTADLHIEANRLIGMLEDKPYYKTTSIYAYKVQ